MLIQRVSRLSKSCCNIDSCLKFSPAQSRQTRFWSCCYVARQCLARGNPHRASPGQVQLERPRSRANLIVRHHRQFTLSCARAAEGPSEQNDRPKRPEDHNSRTQATSTTTDKIPIVERAQNLQARVKDRLSVLRPNENIYTLPNILTFTRLIAAPAVGYLILHDQHAWAVALFAYAGITDLVDGYIARRWNLQTVVGTVIDPMADKLLMTIVTACLAVNGAMPIWLAATILGRDASLAIAAIYYRYASLPEPKTLARYWDFSLPSAEVHPTTVSKYNTFLQLVLIGSTTTLPLITSGMIAGIDVHNAVTNLGYIVAGTTLWSGASYAVSKGAVTILGEDEDLKKRQDRRGRAIIGVSFAAFLGLGFWLSYRRANKIEEEKVQR